MVQGFLSAFQLMSYDCYLLYIEWMFCSFYGQPHDTFTVRAIKRTVRSFTVFQCNHCWFRRSDNSKPPDNRLSMK